ncbi:MAG: polysaccharide deacetylase family protein [Candidatus Moduliflexus flocculans]|nr:polysaccharide deacetylase family protein [Candidatus Moduliflexus flocculans]
MVRSAKGLGTRSLLPAPGRAYTPFPAKDDARDPLVFDHGSRIRRREVSLVFNAYDGAEGLVGILDTLREYGIRATFFVNGEFVRRNPGAARPDSGKRPRDRQHVLQRLRRDRRPLPRRRGIRQARAGPHRGRVLRGNRRRAVAAVALAQLLHKLRTAGSGGRNELYLHRTRRRPAGLGQGASRER